MDAEMGLSLHVRRPHNSMSMRSNLRVRRLDLLDHLVGAGEQRGWDRETQCLCSFEIDSQL
jgi:hypothetical protein